MWQQIVKTHPNATKLVAAHKCSLAAFEAALVFISIIVMLIITSLNLISVVVVAAAAAAAAADLRWCL